MDKIVDPSDSAEQKARKIINWVYRHIDKKPVLSVPNALEVLLNKAGDCNEHAVLVAALLRTAGIPSQIESGLVYLSGRFYYHAWNAVYLGDWVTADAVFNQFPADGDSYPSDPWRSKQTIGLDRSNGKKSNWRYWSINNDSAD